MRLLRRTKAGADGPATATAPEPAPPAEPAVDELIDQIDALGRDNRARRDPEVERRILRLRHIAGARMIEGPAAERIFPDPDFDALPANGDVPEIEAGRLDPGVLRAAILRHGCLLVRGLMDRETALGLADGIERAFADREAQARGEASGETYYEEFVPDPPFPPVSLRPWIEEAGGVLAADSPRLLFEMLESFERVGLRRVISEYLNDGVVISVHKGTLRKAEPATPGAWHQDGSFMGDVHALNVWLSLSHCGDENAPGLDLVPRRLERIVETGTEGASLSDEVSPQMIDEVLAGKQVLRPVFEPGDVLLFDDLFLHKTGSDPAMRNPRYAVESWFFGASGFPADYLPLAF